MKSIITTLFLTFAAAASAEQPNTIVEDSMVQSTEGESTGGDLFFNLACRDDENICRDGLVKRFSIRRYDDDGNCEGRCAFLPTLNRLRGFECGECPKCFADRDELVDAVDAYLDSEDPQTSTVAETYGYPIGSWCVKDVTDFSYLFDGTRGLGLAATFNEDLNSWNVAKAEDMKYMFASSAYNGDISGWDVSNVKEMQGMFEDATDFNGDLSKWNTESLEDTEYMFSGATSFIGAGISSWNVAKVETMCFMFEEADAFNIDIASWDVGRVVDFEGMFTEADVFSQNLCVSIILFLVRLVSSRHENFSNFSFRLSDRNGGITWLILPIRIK